MPECKGCGGSYEDSYNFCPYCGKAKPNQNNIKVDVEIKNDFYWETCEIVFDYSKERYFTFRSDYYFWAEAAGKKGNYCAGRSEINHKGGYPTYYENKKKYYKAQDILNEFTDKLISEGWEFVGTFGDWYQKRFRRKVKITK